MKYNYLILFIKTRKLVLFLFKDTYKREIFNNTSQGCDYLLTEEDEEDEIHTH